MNLQFKIWTKSQHRQYSARITAHLHGEKMHMKLYTMQWYWKKLQKWQPVQN